MAHFKFDTDGLHSRNFWDHVHADNLMSAMRHVAAPWRDDLMEAHLHLCWHFAHEENEHHDFCVSHGIKSVLQLQGIVTAAAETA